MAARRLGDAVSIYADAHRVLAELDDKANSLAAVMPRGNNP